MSKRINIVLPERSIARLEALKDLTDASSVTEVIKHALMTYESLADHLSDGVVFTGHKPNGETFAVEFMIDVDRKTPHLHVVGDGDRKVM
ncbi:hypothetical protein JQW92_24635 [Sulfitobacter pseudonitzschiae]|uniref:hypothetical protein n=1 Tax=Roseobacteraceae TaxID=2854170 RepID=UPI00193A420E|nr:MULTISPECIES: hypothetical protein [Roseobacteraceae]MBM1500816.1 hypothetical protein [Sulfitobacter mediterraneus]MBM1581764.1 hypothetical protein [Sulfitobacter mediterraneus]MBM1818206.1 hypothetical protein [Pseudosulfitobacter pseudonitzschiae]MBM1835241.1 hypothetical protein [Pseudosulfitobacter pseudonitzschiae]MBM1840096.1 hypothetical protein [Pseudosulfitobacter pseudonitzschiae]